MTKKQKKTLKRIIIAAVLTAVLALLFHFAELPWFVQLVLWLVPGFSPVLYLVFLLMGVSLGGVDMCVYTMILECCSSNSVGRYSGYYYTVSMAAQVITPILSGVVMDVNPAMLFAYITGMGVLMGLSVAGAKHGDAILIDEVVRREEAAEAE